MSDFIQRLEVEYEELHEKILKLDSFLKFRKINISTIQLLLLYCQVWVMKTYKTILVVRLNNLKK